MEEALGPGVRVTSPDFVLGKNSGTEREIDITLRGIVGSVDVLVMIECRDRKARQGVDWIEQVVQKASDVGAGKVVAVSTSGFTQSAHRLAKSKGVLLRTLDTIDPDGIARWFVSPQLIVYHPELRFVVGVCTDEVTFLDRDTPRGPVKRRHAPLFRLPGTHDSVSLQNILDKLDVEHLVPRIYENLRVDGSPTPCILTLRFAGEPLQLLTRRSPILLKRFEIGLEFVSRELPLELSDARQYREIGGVVAQTSMHEYRFSGGMVGLRIMEMPAEGEKYLWPDECSSEENASR